MKRDLNEMLTEIPLRLVAILGAANFTSALLTVFQVMGALTGFLLSACSLFLLWPKLKAEIKNRYFNDETGTD